MAPMATWWRKLVAFCFASGVLNRTVECVLIRWQLTHSRTIELTAVSHMFLSKDQYDGLKDGNWGIMMGQFRWKLWLNLLTHKDNRADCSHMMSHCDGNSCFDQRLSVSGESGCLEGLLGPWVSVFQPVFFQSVFPNASTPAQFGDLLQCWRVLSESHWDDCEGFDGGMAQAADGKAKIEQLEVASLFRENNNND